LNEEKIQKMCDILKAALIWEKLSETLRLLCCVKLPLFEHYQWNGSPENNSTPITIKFTNEIDLPFPHVKDRIETTDVKTDEGESIGRIGLNNTETMTQLFPSKMSKLSKILDQTRS